MTNPHANNPDPISLHAACLDHGFVRLVDTMGDDSAIVQAARVSYGEGTKTPSDDRGLIRYLMQHRHTTPFEMCEIKLHVKMPIFVARQWIRHRTASVNEMSGRYSVMPDEFYVPEPEDIQPQSTTNKQGREGGYNTAFQHEIGSLLHDRMGASFGDYNSLIDVDLSRELARTVLPLSTYTEFYWKIDLHNLFHFLKLRTDSHAQKEIRVYADAISDMVADWCPVAHEAWVDYQRDAVTLSRMEIEAVRWYIRNPDRGNPPLDKLSGREQSEFLKKLDL